jgi:hypothetical protein
MFSITGFLDVALLNAAFSNLGFLNPVFLDIAF